MTNALNVYYSKKLFTPSLLPNKTLNIQLKINAIFTSPKHKLHPYHLLLPFYNESQHLQKVSKPYFHTYRNRQLNYQVDTHLIQFIFWPF